MKATAYKVVGRYRATEKQSSWNRGKPGTQCKKSVYTTVGDFLKYHPDIVRRWGGNMALDIEFYILVDGKWVRPPKDKGILQW